MHRETYTKDFYEISSSDSTTRRLDRPKKGCVYTSLNTKLFTSFGSNIEFRARYQRTAPL